MVAPIVTFGLAVRAAASAAQSLVADVQAIWLEDKVTVRHIRLALEDNCTSCTRHPNLTMDDGAHSLTLALETEFANCCL